MQGSNEVSVFSYTFLSQVMPNNEPHAHHSWDEQERRAQGIQHFQKRLQTSNGFVRSDKDPNIFAEKLTYKVWNYIFTFMG